MKLRLDFVTNSSSTGYVVIQLTLENGKTIESESEYDTGYGGHFWNCIDAKKRNRILSTVKNGEDLLGALREMIDEFDEVIVDSPEGKSLCEEIFMLRNQMKNFTQDESSLKKRLKEHYQ